MDYDRDKADEMVLALLSLTISEEDTWGARAWKSHDWDVLDRLHAKGYISDPRAKRVGEAESGGGRAARDLFEEHFGRQASPSQSKDTIPKPGA
jgi:hypothetical protein